MPDHVKFELLLTERVAFVSAFNGIIVFCLGIVQGISSSPIFADCFVQVF